MEFDQEIKKQSMMIEFILTCLKLKVDTVKFSTWSLDFKRCM